MLQIKNLTKNYGQVKAVDNISFTAKVGQVLGFLGPNGAGKTTTMQMLTGYLEPSSGQIVAFDLDMADSADKVKKILGYLAEGAPAYDEMTVYNFLNFIAQIRGYKGREKLERIAAIVKKFHLEPVLMQKIETLSKGFRRRLGLAQAIIHDPKILILDEPTDGLDPNQKHEMRNLIRELAHDKIIILSTHILEEVTAVCDRAIVIADGKIIADSTPSALAARAPGHNTVYLTVSKVPGADVKDLLVDVPGVLKIEILSEDQNKLYVCIYPDEGGVSVSQIHHLAYQQGWELLDIKTQKGELEEVFRIITKPYAIAN